MPSSTSLCLLLCFRVAGLANRPMSHFISHPILKEESSSRAKEASLKTTLLVFFKKRQTTRTASVSMNFQMKFSHYKLFTEPYSSLCPFTGLFQSATTKSGVPKCRCSEHASLLHETKPECAKPHPETHCLTAPQHLIACCYYCKEQMGNRAERPQKPLFSCFMS